ncbi:G-type lectin S-receptor-like serine/threonine-protein kinase At4g27290 [Vitis riparia]|uniref:G-type lectin S-receptor-like serine/threonine-protein kinase At4g27290 n=1 Tax=Vitis riparia TaxID=96939 RepID=UPI00155AF508|nr:G-type lectin S-receptor-like serine/threonine-protein kinase At4g27290 [Vitis riparia]
MGGFTILFFFSSTLLSIFRTSAAVDTITQAQSIDDGETIVSAGGDFELGFFSPGSSENRYLGIWYKKISTGTVVWVANRDVPLNDSSGILKLDERGTLVLLNKANMTIWSSNSSRSVQSPVAQLLDTGNLVVRNENDSDPENFLWQSFDYPGDTFLPGMKYGKNLVTGLDSYLTSWKRTDDPSTGDFTNRLDPRGFPQMFLKEGSVVTFRSGPWNGLRFSGMPNLKPNSIYTFHFVLNQKEIYYTYELINRSVVTRMVLSPNGVLQRYTWIDRRQGWLLYLTAQMDNCDRYALCGAYGSCDINNSPACGCLKGFVPKHPNDWNVADWSGGCVRRTRLNCQNGDGFLKYPGVKLPDTQESWFNMTMNLKECKMKCLKNCNCTAYANSDIRNGGSGCVLWFGNLIDIREYNENGQDLYVRMAASELEEYESSDQKKLVKIIVIPIGLAGLILLVIFVILHVLKRKRLKKKAPLGEVTMGHNPERDHTNESEKEDLELPLFDFDTIAEATDNFSRSNKLGQGGFGPVYKGMLRGGQEIAVKRLSKNSRQGLDEFKNEVLCIAKLQHRNLVKLLGYCIQYEEKMLIYEYMPNKSLNSFIFDQTQSMLLDWPKRFHIIKGIARGLLYLHQDSRLRIIHRDLKASNILLDQEMNPKISDFGMARSFEENETEANTTRVVGTYGYMSPEYAVDGLFSVKSDVFSFGVLVLEIVSGKRNRGFCDPDHHLNLLGHAWRLYRKGRSIELTDASIQQSCNPLEVLRSIHVGLLCVQQSPDDRPSMSSVVMMLGSEIALPQPREPGFFIARRMIEAADSSSGIYEPCSVNDITVTFLAAR